MDVIMIHRAELDDAIRQALSSLAAARCPPEAG